MMASSHSLSVCCNSSSRPSRPREPLSIAARTCNQVQSSAIKCNQVQSSAIAALDRRAHVRRRRRHAQRAALVAHVLEKLEQLLHRAAQSHARRRQTHSEIAISRSREKAPEALGDCNLKVTREGARSTRRLQSQGHARRRQKQAEASPKPSGAIGSHHRKQARSGPEAISRQQLSDAIRSKHKPPEALSKATRSHQQPSKPIYDEIRSHQKQVRSHQKQPEATRSQSEAITCTAPKSQPLQPPRSMITNHGGGGAPLAASLAASFASLAAPLASLAASLAACSSDRALTARES